MEVVISDDHCYFCPICILILYLFCYCWYSIYSILIPVHLGVDWTDDCPIRLIHSTLTLDIADIHCSMTYTNICGLLHLSFHRSYIPSFVLYSCHYSTWHYGLYYSVETFDSVILSQCVIILTLQFILISAVFFHSWRVLLQAFVTYLFW